MEKHYFNTSIAGDNLSLSQSRSRPKWRQDEEDREIQTICQDEGFFVCYAWNQGALLNWSCDLVKGISYTVYASDLTLGFILKVTSYQHVVSNVLMFHIILI